MRAVQTDFLSGQSENQSVCARKDRVRRCLLYTSLVILVGDFQMWQSTQAMIKNDQEDCKCKVVVSLFLQLYMKTLLKDTPGVNIIQHLYAHTKHTHTKCLCVCLHLGPRIYSIHLSSKCCKHLSDLLDKKMSPTCI